MNGTFSLNLLGINIGGLIETCVQTLDNVLISQKTSNNENTVRRRSEYQVSLPNVQQLPISIENQDCGLQQPQQQSLDQLQPLVQKTLQLTQIHQILWQLEPLLQRLLQLKQTQPSFNIGVNTARSLDDDTNSKNKLTDNQKVTGSPDSIKKPTLVIPSSNARHKPRKTKEIIFDITEENDFIEATVDMRDIKKLKDIIINVYNDYQLIISDPAKTNNVEIMLPTRVVPEPINKIYKNGILTLKFEKLQKQQQLQQLLQQVQQLLQQQQRAITR
jgi:HSP20 family molecular chaperone IbpA